MINITEGVKRTPIKCVIYGPESIGKTTLASEFPNALIVDVENGSNALNVRRVRCDKSWEELLSTVKEIIETPNICKSIVIDTADWAEYLCAKYVCEKNKKANIDDFGYGKGYTYLTEEFKKLLDLLDEAVDKGLNVVVTAHAKPRKFELPEEMGSFDRYELKTSKNTSPILKEWCDCLLFCNFKTIVISDSNNKKKAQGAKRTIYTTHSAVYDAKNRFNLPEELDMSIDSLKPLFEGIAPKESETTTSPDLVSKLRTLLTEKGIKENDLKEIVALKKQYSVDTPIEEYSEEFIASWILPNISRIAELIKNKKGNK